MIFLCKKIESQNNFFEIYNKLMHWTFVIVLHEVTPADNLTKLLFWGYGAERPVNGARMRFF